MTTRTPDRTSPCWLCFCTPKSSYYQCFQWLFSRQKRNGNQEYLDPQKPDAIFASDDLTAILVIKIAQELAFLSQKSSRSSAMMGLTLSRITILNWQRLSNPWKRLPASLLTSSCRRSKARKSQQLVTSYQLLYYLEKVFAQKRQENSDRFVWVFMILSFLDSAGLSLS